MNVNSVGAINSGKETAASAETENKNSSATNSIFNDGTEFMSAGTGLIDKMQTFFETLEKTDYDPKNSFFPGYSC